MTTCNKRHYILFQLWEPVKLRCFLLDLSYITMNDVNIEAQILGWTKVIIHNNKYLINSIYYFSNLI